MTSVHPFTRFFIRQGYPDFLDLPWDKSLTSWAEICSCIVEVERGLSRHEVVFVNYDNDVFAIKELPPRVGEKEYRLLRELEKKKLPSVLPVGFALLQNDKKRVGERSILITKFLDAIPYRSLFLKSGMERYQDRLLNAIAVLLVRLHLNGFFWGDCSLSNILFKRDAGELQAYMVDAETSEGPYDRLSNGQRQHDLMIMEDNITGALADLSIIVKLPETFAVFEIGEQIKQQYHQLWEEITHDEIFASDERYRIHERIRRINELGFTVDEVELIPTEDGSQLRMKAIVTDHNYHRNQLHALTGIEAEEKQARQILNEIYELKATLSKREKESIPLRGVAFHWTNKIYLPAI
ncbi:MAG: DUF4032 domain-containing protein, partial [Candidatus Heimdallarchaeota archaeon]|nr:DUF4032 domain-containing protein [Candidatus Heimdallarchaeota archaeon]